jgi:hypothetical protein
MFSNVKRSVVEIDRITYPVYDMPKISYYSAGTLGGRRGKKIREGKVSNPPLQAGKMLK